MLREGRLEEIPQVTRDDSLRRYVEQRVALKAQIAEQARTLLPQHPRMKELAGELAGLDAEIRGEAEKTVAALESDAKLAAADVDSLAATLAKQSKTVASGNADDVKLRALQLDAKTAGDQLESYLQKYREALAREAENAAPADARVIAAASEPRVPTFPKKGPTILLATLAGFLVSLGAVVAHSLLTEPTPNAARTSEDLGDKPAPEEAGAAEQAGAQVAPATAESQSPAPEAAAATAGDGAATAPPPVASVAPPTVDRADPAAVAAEPSALAENGDVLSIAALAERLAGIGPRQGAALTALVAGEVSGRAAGLGLALARALAARGRAALIDLGDYPELADVPPGAEGVEPGVGLAELLDGRASFGEAIYRDRVSALDVIPAGAGAVAVEPLGEALTALAGSYDYLVLHAYDWRSPQARAARDGAAVLAVCAAPARLEAALAEARGGLSGDSIVIVGVKSGDANAAERAA